VRVIVFDTPNRPQQPRLTLLSFVPGIAVVSSVASTMALMVAVETTPCDVVLLTLAYGPNPAGMDVLRRLARQSTMLPVVVVSDTDDPLRVDQALSLGAVGYVLSSAPREELIVALTLAAAGAAYLQPTVAREMLKRRLEGTISGSEMELSRRQMQLLTALALGLTNKEIAQRLQLAPGTVNDYMKQLFERLGVVSRAAAVSVGMRRGLIS
jgi:DNA-binding NarL/FixJ family response regulator